MKLLRAANYYPPPPVGVPAPVRIEINFDPDAVDRGHAIPQWPFSFEISTADFRGIAQAGGGTVEAMNEEQAIIRIYGSVIDTLAEMLAARIKEQAR